jgi:DNA-binding MarR family transcriptional regulator
VDTGARREFEILRALAQDRLVTQRVLAQRIGIALGLANLYVKRLVRKGHVKVITVPPNRIRYLLTPRGLGEKTRLTYEYMRYSLRLYRESRQNLREILAPLCQGSVKRVAIYGTGEAAELAYLTLKELRIEPSAILDGDGTDFFLGYPVRRLSEVAVDDFDYVILATLESPERICAEFERRGILRQSLIALRASTSGGTGSWKSASSC